MEGPRPRAAELILDDNGVWLRAPARAHDDSPEPPHVLAARELAIRLARPGAIEELATAFERRLAGCGEADGGAPVTSDFREP